MSTNMTANEIAVTQDSEEYHKGWFHTIKLLILVLKVLIVGYLSMKAMKLRHHKY